MKRANLFLTSLCGFGLSLLSPALTNGQTSFRYAAKFVCGSSDGEGAARVVPGAYATSINIYNPSGTDVELRKNVALTFPPEEQAPGAVSEVIVDTLSANAALQVDCGEIPSEFSFPGGAPNSPYTEGFLILESRSRLNVTAVYTATGPSGGVSVDVEEVGGAKVKAAKGNSDHLTICHLPPGNPSNAHTLVIGASAWPAHQSHGDTMGACP